MARKSLGHISYRRSTLPQFSSQISSAFNDKLRTLRQQTTKKSSFLGGNDLSRRLDGFETLTRQTNANYRAMKNEIKELKEICKALKKQVNTIGDSRRHTLAITGFKNANRKVAWEECEDKIKNVNKDELNLKNADDQSGLLVINRAQTRRDSLRARPRRFSIHSAQWRHKFTHLQKSQPRLRKSDAGGPTSQISDPEKATCHQTSMREDIASAARHVKGAFEKYLDNDREEGKHVFVFSDKLIIDDDLIVYINFTVMKDHKMLSKYPTARQIEPSPWMNEWNLI